MLTVDVAMESSIGRQLTQRWPNDTSRHAYLAAYLLTEAAKGSESAWWPYLQSLPASTAHLASAWSEEELQWLQGTEALEIARENQQDIRNSYEQARALPSFPFTYESYAHARRLVFSRVFSYAAANGNRSSTLVPLTDLINHASKGRYNTEWTYNTTLQVFTMYSTAPLAAHQPLLTSYGLKCNSELLTGYGFVVEDNEREAVAMEYEGVEQDGTPVAKTTRLKASYGDSHSMLLVLNMRRSALHDVIAQLKGRLHRAQSQTLTEEELSEKQRGMRVMVERRLVQRLAEAVRKVDDRYGGDREAEAARLAEWSGEKGKQWQALVVRVGERRVLQWWLDVCALGEHWLADGVSSAQSWEGERAEVERLKVQLLVRDAWVKALEDEKAEHARSARATMIEL